MNNAPSLAQAQPLNVLITGASSGLGRALAEYRAAPGVTLYLSGRDPNRLADAAHAATLRGAIAHTQVIDVCDRHAMAQWIESLGHLDVVIANAGVSAGTLGHHVEREAQIRDIFATNLDGALNTVLPALTVMRRQAPGADGVRGRIGAVASIAAFVPAPGAPSYCASKAALDAWMVASTPAARQEGIVLSSICPGYVVTPMTDANRFPMPGLMPAHDAARRIWQGLDANRPRIAFPWWMEGAARLAGLLPARAMLALLGRAPGKDEARDKDAV